MLAAQSALLVVASTSLDPGTDREAFEDGLLRWLRGAVAQVVGVERGDALPPPFVRSTPGPARQGFEVVNLPGVEGAALVVVAAALHPVPDDKAADLDVVDVVKCFVLGQS